MNYQKVQHSVNKRGTQPNLVGQTYNRLTVIGPCRLLSEGQAAWGCRCACGGTTTAMTWQLQSGFSKSCGCLRGRPRKRGNQ